MPLQFTVTSLNLFPVQKCFVWLSPGIMRVAGTQDGKVRSIDCVSRKHFGGSMLEVAGP